MNKIYFLIPFLLLTSCDRAEKKSVSKVTFNLPAQQTAETQNPRKLNPNGTINPTALSDINCYGVLVSGPEDILRRNQCTFTTTAGSSTTASFDVGFFVGGFFRSAAGNAITFDVPSGKDRAFRLVGFQVDTSSLTTAALTPDQVCSQFKTKEVYQNYMSDPFILGQAGGVELVGGATQQIDLTATFNSNLQVGDCNGPDFQSNKNGLPAKLAVMIQDYLGESALKNLNQNSCVGVKFQLQDANGFSPDLSANPHLTAQLKVDYNSLAMGTFYNPQIASGGSTDCTNAIAVSGDLTLSFFNTTDGKAFQDILLYFKPNSASPAARAFNLSDQSQILAGVTKTFNYANTSPVLTHYGLYDLYNNVSTEFANTALKRSFVRRNECRPASLQFFDAPGVPASINVASPPNPILINDSETAGAILFYPSYSDCVNGANGNDYLSLIPQYPSTVYSMGFAYKIVSNSVTSFSFTISNVSSGNTDLIGSGDLTAASNFWGAIN